MSTITTINSGDLITNSRTDLNNNFANLNADKMETSVLDTDTTLAANSDSKVATQKAVKAYVDAGGNVNASETTKGIVEEATDAEVTAGTATGGTGAKLFVTPAKLLTNLTTLAYSKVRFPGLTDTPVDYDQSITETPLFTTTITAGDLGTDKLIKGRVYITNYETNSATETLTIRLKYGTTTLCSAVLDPGSTIAANSKRGFIDFVVMADGSASAQSAVMHIFIFDNTLDGQDAATGVNNITTGTATENSATNLTLQVTGQWSTAGGTHNITTAIGYSQVVR